MSGEILRRTGKFRADGNDVGGPRDWSPNLPRRQINFTHEDSKPDRSLASNPPTPHSVRPVVPTLRFLYPSTTPAVAVTDICCCRDSLDFAQGRVWEEESLF